MSGRLEVVRIVSDWLQADVNTRIRAMPVDTGDSVPPVIGAYTDTTYPTTTIAVFDETRHPWVADRLEPPAWPALYVQSQGVLVMAGEPTPDGQIRATKAPLQIAIRYLSHNADSAHAIRDGYYTMRAVARSLRELDKNSNSASRVRNGVNCVLAETLDFYPVVQAVGAGRVAGALVANFYVRDQNPSF